MSDKFYNLLKSISNVILGVSEEFLKQWLGTVIGQRVLKFIIDFLVSRLFSEVVEPLMRVGVIRAGYYYDINDAQEKIKKLKNAEDSNDKKLYIDTLNSILRK